MSQEVHSAILFKVIFAGNEAEHRVQYITITVQDHTSRGQFAIDNDSSLPWSVGIIVNTYQGTSIGHAGSFLYLGEII